MRTHFRWLMVAAIALLLPLSCNKDTFFDDDLAVDDQITFRAEDEEGGNNLSMPVITPGQGESPVGMINEPIWANPVDYDDGLLYLQQSASKWRASSFHNEGNKVTPLKVDWGDNLEAKAWGTNSIIRVEVVLFDNVADRGYVHEGNDENGPDDDPTTFKGYNMYHYFGLGMDEMWGTDQSEFGVGETSIPDAPAWATVYDNTASLVIQRISGLDEEPPELSWNGTQWVGLGLDPPVIGPTNYSAEVNVKGRVIYGYNWKEKRPLGIYRITFSANKILFEDGYSSVESFSEVEEVVVAAEDEGGESPNITGVGKIDFTANVTYIDVRITKENNGGGGGGGKPDNPGGGGDKPDNPGKGGGKPDNPGNGGGNGPGGKNATTTDNVSTATSTNTGGYYSNRPAYNYKPKTNKSTNTTDKNTNSNGKYDTGTKGSKATPSFDNNQDKNDTGKGKTSKPKGRRG